MSPPSLLTVWSEVLLESLAAAGVRDAVLSPGSRSTPFVLAACRCERLRLHDVIDERAAAFYALGQARASGRPSLLICTSGTAPAHYLPAVIEAGLAGLPLVILSADRPFELQGCAAPQTVDQIKLFSGHARGYFELGLPDEDDLQKLASDSKQPIERVRDVMYPGLTRKLTTADNADMVVSYGTSADVGIEDETHTGTQVRVAAFGPHAANVVGLTDQTDLFFTMTDAMGIDRTAK